MAPRHLETTPSHEPVSEPPAAGAAGAAEAAGADDDQAWADGLL